jgi:hypothetical protein
VRRLYHESQLIYGMAVLARHGICFRLYLWHAAFCAV